MTTSSQTNQPSISRKGHRLMLTALAALALVLSTVIVGAGDAAAGANQGNTACRVIISGCR